MALNQQAVLQGAVSAMWLVVPAVLANAWLAGQDDPNVVLALISMFGLLAGFVFGGYSAARVAGPGTPLMHGAASAAVAWAAVQVLSIAIRLFQGDGISPVQIVFTALLAASCGVVGGLLANRSVSLGRNR